MNLNTGLKKICIVLSLHSCKNVNYLCTNYTFLFVKFHQLKLVWEQVGEKTLQKPNQVPNCFLTSPLPEKTSKPQVHLL